MDRDRERDRDRLLDRERDLDRRDRDRDLDRRERFDRRDEIDRRFDREDRDRPGDHWKRDRPPSRAESRLPSTPTVPSGPPTTLPAAPSLADRLPDPSPDLPRKPSVVESRRDIDRIEPPAPRPEPTKEVPPPVKRSPPPAAPQVPAFGSVTAPIPDLSPEKPPPPPPESAAPPATPAKLEKEPERPEPPSRPAVQPPTGPKAERTPAPLPPLPPVEVRARREDAPREDAPDVQLELPARPPKAPTGPVPSAPKRSDLSPPTAPAAMAGKDAVVSPLQSPSATRPLPTMPSPEMARTLPPAGRGSSPDALTSPRPQPAGAIPTGPRALQHRASISRGPKGMKQWVRPGYPRPPPAPGATAPPKRESIDATAQGPPSSDTGRRDSHMSVDDGSGLEAGEIAPEPEVLPPKREPPRSPTPPTTVEVKAPPTARPFLEAPVEAPPEAPAETPAIAMVDDHRPQPIPDFARSSDEEEEENVVFTQDYLEERKRIFEKDLTALRADLPPSPLTDPTTVNLLLRIQLLGMIANETPPAQPPTPTPALAPAPVEGAEKLDGKAPVTSPDAKPEVPADGLEVPTKMDLDTLPPPADVVTVDHLPFLHSGPPTPISDLDTYHANKSANEARKDVFHAEMMKRRKEVARKNAALRQEYLSFYIPWRLQIWDLDRQKNKPIVSPDPASPPTGALAGTPTPIPETREGREGREGRRYKGNSELDFQNALRASEISAQEELERRRGNKITAHPDLAREAEIPDMLELPEARARIYKDTNNIVDASKAMEVFEFSPPPDDFTPEEHEVFTDAFMAHPKKWGKIAESLPGRGYAQCIVHYYLTKEEIKYKAKLNKRWSRRGRARRSARPKSNALMVDLGVVKPDYVGEEEPAPVTDTGRPRRAAAPTFGDSSADADHSNGRRGNSGKDGEAPEKPAGRRGGARTGAGTRGGRRGKAAQQQQLQQQLLQQKQQQQKTATPAAAESPVPPLPVGVVASSPAPPTKAEPAGVSMDGTIETTVLQSREPVERAPTEAPPRSKSGRGRQRDSTFVLESTETESPGASAGRQSESGHGSLQPTSYWSVPEQRDFPTLLAHFGRNFEGISNFMKTKTTVMVSTRSKSTFFFLHR